MGTRIKLKGPPLLVSPSAAQTLGMAIHELATNAGKYGALSISEGRVAINWGLEGDGARGETFAMSWREQGGPTVSSPSRNGFGSTVIGALAESSLDAKVDLDFVQAGLSWCLHCRAAGVIEEPAREVGSAETQREHRPYEGNDRPYFTRRLGFTTDVAAVFGPFLFEPLVRLVTATAKALRIIQSGHLNFYLSLIGLLLVAILLSALV